MGSPSRQKVVIIGCGNVAWHIAKKLNSIKSVTFEVYNHGVNKHLEEFWKQFKCKTTVGLDHVTEDADLYFICVSDAAIADTAKFIHAKNPRALLLHTSGSTEIGELGKRIHGTGVFYPVQTFSRNDEINWKDLPILIEGGDSHALAQLRKLAGLFSDDVRVVNYNERLKVHLSAVLVNNFVNALYVAAAGLLKKDLKTERTVNLEVLMPLIRRTALKASEMHPLKAQTGPAKRKDKRVIKKHLHVLENDELLYKVYKGMTRLIQEQQHKDAELQGKTK